MSKRLIVPSITILFSLIIITSAIYFFYLPTSKRVNSSELVSPIITEPPYNNLFKADLYTKMNREKTIDNYPPSQYFPENLEPLYRIDLDLSANAYAVIDRDTRKLLLGKNITDEKQIASLTKVMTAVVSLNKEKLGRQIVISKNAFEVGEASMGTSVGEIYTLEDLLHGLLMVSGNDAAEAIANSLGRGRFWFISEMNKKAYELGMKDTYFVNPTGLDGETPDKSTFSTSLDLLALTNYALSLEKFSEIVATKYYEIPIKEDNHKAIFLNSLLSYDRSYPGIKGVKTGSTDFARQTLISYAENNNRRIIAVFLDSEATRDDAVKIYRYIFEGRTDWP